MTDNPQTLDNQERFRRAEQLAFAGTLAGGLVHEIKNPLNSLHMNLQLLAEDWQDADTPRERRALKRIQTLQAETSRLCAILEDFMRFVRGQPLQRTECDLNRLVDDVLLFVKPEMDKQRIELKPYLCELPRARVDANLIKQALLNLLLNAAQAMPPEGPREILVRTGLEGASAKIDIIDTGRGIKPEEMGRIFDAFYSTRRGGTGLGLPTTRRIIEEHGGLVHAQSEPGRGSCFSILLPLSEEA